MKDKIIEIIYKAIDNAFAFENYDHPKSEHELSKSNEFFADEILKLIQFFVSGWIPIEKSKPKPQQRVYVVCENPKYGGGVIRFQTMAEYIPYMTVKEEGYMADEFHGDGDYNEEEDEYYTPEGFYEWQSEPDMSWKISAKVTHWMPLIALP